MLMTLINIGVATISIGLAIFVFYPPPSPSPFVHQLEDTAKSHLYNNYKVYYQDFHSDSNADTVVLLHGFPTSSYDFYKIVPGLRKKFKDVILIDFLGFGFSDKPIEHEYSIKSQADVVESVLSSLNMKSVNILSHDYGDTVAQELLARQATSGSNKLDIKTVCLLNGGIFPETNKPFLIQKILSTPIIGSLLSRLMNYRTFSLRMSDLFGPDTKPSEQELRDMWHLSAKQNGYALAPNLLSYISQRIQNRDRWVGALQETKVPILMIYGPADLVNPEPFSEHFRNTLPKAEIKVLDEKIGHYPQLEAPKDVLDAYFNFYDKYKTEK